MSEFLIEIIRYLLAPSLLAGVLFAFVEQRKSRLGRWILAVSCGAGLAISIAIFTAKRLHPKKLLKTLTKLNRQLIGGTFLLILLATLLILVLCLVYKLSRTKQSPVLETGFLLFACLAFVTMLSTTLPFVLLKSKELVAFGEDSFGTASLFRLGGYLGGLLCLFLLGLSLYQIYLRLPKQQATYFSGLMLLALTFDYCLKGVSSLARLRVLKSSNDLVFSIMILDDKSLGLVAGLYLLVCTITAVYVYLTHRKLKGEFPTPAARRKERWWLRNSRRWAKSTVVFALFAYLVVTVLLAHISKPVELTPPQEFQETAGQIIVPLTEVDDGHLHRFSYKFEGHDIRFIVVRKPQGNAYGVGLDACDICGVAGYYERNDDVICKRCDVVMNKATIGFKGGCNPVPFNYELKDGKIVIDKAVLEAEKNRFPKGD